MTIKKALMCLSIVAIVMFCTLNVVTASTGNYSTAIHNSARHTNDHMPMARGSTPNGILNRNYVTEGILASSASNGIVYVGSFDNNVYALDVVTGAKVWNYTTGGHVWSKPSVANGIVYVGSNDNNVYALDARTGVNVWNYTTGESCVLLPHRRQRDRLRWE